jgi:hypothetical protein
MPGAKQNDIKAKLDGMNQVPEGCLFNSEETWQKLEAKLQKQKSKKPALWFYAAAMIIALIVTGFFLQNNNTVRNKNTPGKEKSIVSQPLRTLQLPKQESKREVQTVKNTITPAGHTQALVRKTQPAVAEPLQPKTSVVLEEKKEQTMMLPDTNKAIVMMAPPKRKFRIAHINELRTPETIPMQQSTANNPIVYKRSILSTVTEEPLYAEEKLIQRKKMKSILSLVSSSQ